MVKNLTIREEAYQYLKTIKMEHESFSDIIMRLKQPDIMELAGTLTHWDANEAKKAVRNLGSDRS